MKLIVVHGDHTQESYERLRKFIDVAKGRGWDIQKITDSSKNIPEYLVSDSLFIKSKLVVVEGANLINKSSVKWIKSKSKDLNTNMVLYHKGTVSKTLLKSLPVDKVEEYKLPKLIWNFLDSFYPGNAKTALFLLEEIAKNEPVEFVFSLLARQLRDVYWVKIDPKDLSYPSWRIGKLKSQGNKFKEGQIEKVINELASADIKSKTSQENVKDLLAFIIASELE